MPIARRLVVSVAAVVVRVLEGAMLASASSLLLATLLVAPLADPEAGPWIGPLSRAVLPVAGVLAAAAVGGFLLMPAQRDMLRQSADAPIASAASTALLALLFAAVLQLPLLMNWWGEAATTAGQLAGNDPDPLGLMAIPKFLIYLLPGLSSIALVLVTAASLLSLAARREVSDRILGACAALQAGLVVSMYLLRSSLFRLGTALVDVLPPADPTTGLVGQWLARHDALATSMSYRLVGLTLGNLAILALWDVLSPRVPMATPGDDQLSAGVEPRAAWPRPAGTNAHPGICAFDESIYTARPKMTLAESVMGRRYSEYEIQSVPPSSRKHFSFSWATGVLRQEPNGPDLVRLEPPSRPRRLLRRPYAVVDAQSGATLGRIVPAGRDWEVFDGTGGLIAEVLEVSSGYAAATYVLNAGDVPICRYRWSLQGATVLSAALDVEFEPIVKMESFRAFAMALMPILEQKARLTSEFCA